VPRDAPDAGLAFVLHDLCHLEKLFDPAHHEEQRGFFAALFAASDSPAWATLDARLDDAWRRDVEHVAADMNGSAIFLFAALKMKLKMASRRALGARTGRAAKVAGPLDDGEASAFAEDLELLLDALDVRGDVRNDARAVSTKRDAVDAGERLARWFARA